MDVAIKTESLNVKKDTYTGNVNWGVWKLFLDGKRDLYIRAVIHKVFVNVNEEGTGAAAASGVSMGATSVPPPPIVFHTDHPFRFLIKDNKSNSILFIWTVVDFTV